MFPVAPPEAIAHEKAQKEKEQAENDKKDGQKTRDEQKEEWEENKKVGFMAVGIRSVCRPAWLRATFNIGSMPNCIYFSGVTYFSITMTFLN